MFNVPSRAWRKREDVEYRRENRGTEMRGRTSQPSWDIFGDLGPILADLGPSWPDLGPILGDLGPSYGSLKALLGPSESPRWPERGERWAQDGPRNGSKIELKRGRGVKNRVLTLLTRSITHLDAICSHLQRSEADLTPHVRSVLALLHPNEPPEALLRPS